MKKLILLFLLLMLPSCADAQCNGIFAPNTICGNLTGSAATPSAFPAPSGLNILATDNTWTGYNAFNGGASTVTRSPGDSTTNIATTAFVQTAVTGNLLPLNNIWTGLNTFNGGVVLAAPPATNTPLTSNITITGPPYSDPHHTFGANTLNCNFQATDHSLSCLKILDFFGGTSIQGLSEGAHVENVLISPTSTLTVDNSRQYAGGSFISGAHSEDNGTMGTPKGMFIGLVGQSQNNDDAGTGIGATFPRSLVGLEGEAFAFTGSSPFSRVGVSAVDYGSGVQGTAYDIAFSASAAFNPSVGWKYAFAVSPQADRTFAYNYSPMNANGTILATIGAGTVTNGIDISSYTFTGNEYNSANFQITGAGAVQTKTGNLTVGTANPAATTNRKVQINGAGSGAGGGSNTCGVNGVTTSWCVGNVSSLLGGAFDNTIGLYSANALSFYSNGTLAGTVDASQIWTTTSNLIVGPAAPVATTKRTVAISGAASGAGGGSSVCGINGANTSWCSGNASALFGGAFDNTYILYSMSNAISFYSNNAFAGNISTAQKWVIGNAFTTLGGSTLTVNRNATGTGVSYASVSPSPVVNLIGVDGANADLVMQEFGVSSPNIRYLQARGTQASPTATQVGDALAGNFAYGYATSGGAGYVSNAGAGFIMVASENYTATAAGASLNIFTTQIGTATFTNSATFQSSGGFSVGTTTDPGIGRITANVGYNVGATAGLSVTKTVRAAGGASDCTLIFTGGILTGGSC